MPCPQVNPQRPQDLRLIVNDKHSCHVWRSLTHWS
jgi:hypothetical protein